MDQKGGKYSIVRRSNGLYYINKTTDGARPKICQEGYTSFNEAELSLVKYLKARDKLGFAVYPEKLREFQSAQS